MERKTWVKNWVGNLSLKVGGVAPDFDSRFGGIETTGELYVQYYMVTDTKCITYDTLVLGKG